MTESDWVRKPAPEWQVVDLQNVAGAEEGAYLELKKASEFIRNGRFSWDVFAEQLASTASAFLNSDGGILLLGVQTVQHEADKKRESLAPLADWVIGQTFGSLNIKLSTSQVWDRVYGNLSPKPFGIEVTELKVTVEDTSASVFVISVPPSATGAHQSLKSMRYHRRTADGDPPMADWEIRDVNNRRAGPLLEVYLHGARVNDDSMELTGDSKRSSIPADQRTPKSEGPYFPLNLETSVVNLGRGVATVVRVDVGIPAPWTRDPYGPDDLKRELRLDRFLGAYVTVLMRPDVLATVPFATRRKRLTEQPVQWWTLVYRGDRDGHPLWPLGGMLVPIGGLGVRRPTPTAAEEYSWIPWRIMAENMPEIRGAALARIHRRRASG